MAIDFFILLVKLGLLGLYIISAFEPPHDKANNVVVHPAKAQINLDIRPV